MPIFRKHPILKIGRGKIVYLDLEVGVRRDELVEANNDQALSEALKSTRHRLESETRKVARLRAKLAKQRSATRAPVSENGSPQVFFLVGQGKSGTGWLMQMLNSHPEVLCWGEGQFFGTALSDRGVERIKSGEDRNRNRPSGSLYNAITGSEPIRLWVEHSIWTKNADPDRLLNRLVGVAIEHFLIRRLSKTDKRIV
jgi:hypothetical protein